MDSYTPLLYLFTTFKMKKSFLILFVFFYSFVSQSQTVLTKEKQFQLVGKIINQPILSPDCGNTAFGTTVIEFEIQTFSDSTYSNKNIGLIFTCPELFGKDFLSVGRTYQITLSNTNQANFNYSILNEKDLEKYKLTYKPWVISAKRLD